MLSSIICFLISYIIYRCFTAQVKSVDSLVNRLPHYRNPPPPPPKKTPIHSDTLQKLQDGAEWLKKTGVSSEELAGVFTDMQEQAQVLCSFEEALSKTIKIGISIDMELYNCDDQDLLFFKLGLGYEQIELVNQKLGKIKTVKVSEHSDSTNTIVLYDTKKRRISLTVDRPQSKIELKGGSVKLPYLSLPLPVLVNNWNGKVTRVDELPEIGKWHKYFHKKIHELFKNIYHDYD